jgi:hypothetical protein
VINFQAPLPEAGGESSKTVPQPLALVFVGQPTPPPPWADAAATPHGRPIEIALDVEDHAAPGNGPVFAGCREAV